MALRYTDTCFSSMICYNTVQNSVNLAGLGNWESLGKII